MPAKLGAQCAFGMFIAILMTGIFPEARAEPVVLRPPASPGGRIEITTGLARLLPLEKRAKTVIVGDHNLIEEGVPLPPTGIYLNITNDLSTRRGPPDNLGKQGGSIH